MYLNYIEITNYRPYYGKQRINFDFNDKENITVILADNGSGKTSFVNALTWCLYGEELHDVKDKTEPLYNLQVAKEKEEYEEIPEISVQVIMNFFYMEKGIKKEFNISRELKFEKWGDNWNIPLNDYLIVTETDKDILEDELAQYRINNVLPKDMFHYFFFNGATLSNYFDNNADFNLKNSVEEISQISLIDKVCDHLVKTSDDLNKNFNKKQKNSGTINYYNKINKNNQEIHNLNTKKKDLSNSMKDAHTNIIRYEDKLSAIDSEKVNDLINARDDYSKQKNDLTDKIQYNTERYEKKVLELYPIVKLSDMLFEAYDIVDKAKEKKSAPPNIEKPLLQDILNDDMCICGVKLSENPECLKEIKRRLENISDLTTGQFYDEYFHIRELLKKMYEIPKINELKKDIDDDEKNLEECNIKLKGISDKLSKIDENSVNLYEKELKENKKRYANYEREKEYIIKKIEQLKKENETFEKKQSQKEEMEGELKELSDKLDFCNEAIKIGNSLNKKIKNHIREKINKNTKDQFTNIAWDYNKYNDVIVNEDYEIEITKSSGNIIKPDDLSDGEEHLLALSFIMALHSLSGFEVPLIIDAALESLDKTKRIEFIKGLHKYTYNKQIVFLFTDSQYTKDVRRNMLEHVAEEYGLFPSENKTEIRKYDKQ